MSGRPLTLRWQEVTTNSLSGAIVTVDTDVSVRRGVLLPVDEARRFTYDLSYIAAQKNFTTGAYYYQTDTVCLIDGREVSISLDGVRRLIAGSRTFEVLNVSDALEGTGYWLSLKGLADV